MDYFELERFYNLYSKPDVTSNTVNCLSLRMKHYYDDTRSRLVEIENHGILNKFYSYPHAGILMPLKIFMREIVSYDYYLILTKNTNENQLLQLR